MGKWLLGKPSWLEDSRVDSLDFAVFDRNGRVLERVGSARVGFSWLVSGIVVEGAVVVDKGDAAGNRCGL